MNTMALSNQRMWVYFLCLFLAVCHMQSAYSEAYTLSVGGSVTISQSPNNGGYIDNVGLADFIDPHLGFSKNSDGTAKITLNSYFDYTTTVKLVFIERYQSYYSGKYHTRAATYYKDISIKCNYVKPESGVSPTKVLLPERVRANINVRTNIYATLVPSGATATDYSWDQEQGTAVFAHGQDTNGGFHVTGRSPGLGRAWVKVNNDNNLRAETIIEVVDPNFLPPNAVFLPSSIEISIGGHATLEPILEPQNTSTSYTWKSDNENVAIVNYGKVTGIKEGTATITVTTGNELTSTCNVIVVGRNGKDDEMDDDNSTKGTIDGHEYVDLGLSVKWATCNVGASTPEGYGAYYAWGETSEKETYSWDTYKYGSSAMNCTNIGSDIKGTNYDAAYVNWGSNWRMPNEIDMGELISKCIFSIQTQNGVDGFLVTGPNGNSIFLPTANSKFTSSYSGCRYWTSTVSDYNGMSLLVAKSGSNVSPSLQARVRAMGLPIRAVTEATGTSVGKEKLNLSASPSSGEVASGTKVTLTAKANGSTVSADIYYTLNGTTPTKNSTKFTSSGITINSDCTLKAIAYMDGYETSDVGSWTYTIASKPKLTLSASPSGGSVESGTKVYLTAKADGSMVSGADIYYTTNGTLPSKSSMRYNTSGISITQACTLKAIAYKDGYETSEVLTEDYSVEIEAENISLPSEKKIKIGGASTWISATLTPENATSKISWRYTNNGVISVNSYGNSVSIQGMKAGTAYVYAKIPNGKEDFCRIEVENNGDGDSFYANGITYEIISTEERTCKLKKCNLSKVVIPESVQGYSVVAIGSSAFGGYDYDYPLTTIDIPHSIETIEGGAFFFCKHLLSLRIPNSVKYIGEGITEGCSELSSITVEESNLFYDSREGSNAIIETNSNKLIAGCKSTKIPYTIKIIGAKSFSWHDGIMSMEIPKMAETIEKRAFYGCKNLTAINLSETKINDIGEYSFSMCTSLNKVELPNSLKSIGNSAFNDCSSLFSINIPNKVDSIAKSTFWGCSSLVSISLPQNMTCIGESAFWGCEKLANIVLPESLQKIGKWAFNDCSGIVSLVIPASVTSIGDYAFDDCTSLTALYSLLETPFDTERSLGGTYSAFYNVSQWATLYIPKGSVKKYQDAKGWNEFKTIREFSGKLTLEVDNEKNLVDKGTIVKLSSNVEGARIYYTLDGTMPGRLSKLYTPTGIVLTESCTLKAIAYKAGYIESDVLSISYNVHKDEDGIIVGSWDNTTPFWTAFSPTSFVNKGQKLHYEFTNYSSKQNIWNNWLLVCTNCHERGEVGFFEYFVLRADQYGWGEKYLQENHSFSWPDGIKNWTAFKEDMDGAKVEMDIIRKGDDLTIEVVMKATNGKTYSERYFVNGVTENKIGFFLTVEGGHLVITKSEILENNYMANIASSGYATFYSSQSAYTLPNGLSAQVITNVSNSKLTYKTIADGSVSGVIPAGTAVMLVNDSKISGTYILTASENTTTYTSTNLLCGSDEAQMTTGDGYHYKLSYGMPGTSWSDVFGWYWGAEDGGSFMTEGHKAWLVVPKSAATTRGFTVDGETTGISTLEVSEGEAVYFDLLGRRVMKPTVKGVYIKNGKKVMMK